MPETKIGQVLVLLYLAPSLVCLLVKHDGKISDLCVYTTCFSGSCHGIWEQCLYKPELISTCIFQSHWFHWQLLWVEYPCGCCVTAMILKWRCFYTYTFWWSYNVATLNTYACCLWMTSKIPAYIVSQSVPYVDFWFWLSVLNKRWQIAFFGIVASQILQKQKVHAMFRNMSNQFLLVKCLITSLPENVTSLLPWFLLPYC